MRTLVTRLTATFIYNAGAILPASSILGGWPIWKAAVVAGVAAMVELLVRESKAYLDNTKAVTG